MRTTLAILFSFFLTTTQARAIGLPIPQSQYDLQSLIALRHSFETNHAIDPHSLLQEPQQLLEHFEQQLTPTQRSFHAPVLLFSPQNQTTPLSVLHRPFSLDQSPVASHFSCRIFLHPQRTIHFFSHALASFSAEQRDLLFVWAFAHEYAHCLTYSLEHLHHVSDWLKRHPELRDQNRTPTPSLTFEFLADVQALHFTASILSPQQQNKLLLSVLQLRSQSRDAQYQTHPFLASLFSLDSNP